MWIALAPEEQGLSKVVAASLHLIPTLLPKKHHGSIRGALAAAAQGEQTILLTSASVWDAPAPCTETSQGGT
ncbi:hypothetical protein B5G37_13460 [Pseudoflavonifractor sp. An85]|nr:hypothetical protein B5G37_13460 [Pseudoflavonifractor sp. An85]